MLSPSPPPPPSQSSQSSTAYKVEEIVTTIRLPVLRPKPAFLKVLRLGGGSGETFTMSDIIEHMKTYIEDRKLYDEQDPRFIYCQNDLLGEALNVSSFTLGEALKLFWQNCSLTPDSCLRIRREIVTTPVEEAESSSTSDEPKPATDLSPGETSRETHSTSTPVPLTSQTPSSSQNPISLSACQPSTSITLSDIEEHEGEQVNEDSDDATKESVKPVKDDVKPSTSVNVMCDEPDGGRSPWSCQVMVQRHDLPSQQRVRNDSLVVEYTSDSFSVEYELVSSSETELVPDKDNDESEESLSSCDRTAVFVLCQESDIEYLADYSDSNSDSDAELSNEDKWDCNQCKFKNSAMYRNCERCWSIRPDWLAVPSSSNTNDGAGNIFGDDECVDDCNNAYSSKLHDEAKCNSSKLSALDTVSRGETAVNLNTGREGLSVGAEKLPLDHGQEVCMSQDSAIGSLFSSQEHPSLTPLPSSLNSLESQKSPDEEEKVKDDVKTNSKIRKRKFSSDLSESDEEADLKKSRKDLGRESDLKPSDPCVICLTRSKTASIIHGKTGHQVCCYRCAKRLKLQRKSCPICRRPIQKVIRNYF